MICTTAYICSYKQSSSNQETSQIAIATQWPFRHLEISISFITNYKPYADLSMLADLKCLQSFKMYTRIFMYYCKKLNHTKISKFLS